MRLVPQGQEFKFNPAGDKKDRDEAIEKWRKLDPGRQTAAEAEGQIT